MTNNQRRKIVAECYEGADGKQLVGGRDASEWRDIADQTGDDDAWETAFVLANVDEYGAKETLRRIEGGKLV